MTRTHSPSLRAALLVILALVSLLALAPVARSEQRAQATPPPPPNAPKDTQTPEVQQVAEWYVSPLGKALGPYTIDELIKLFVERTIDSKTPVWRDGMSDWVLLRDVPELQPVIAAGPKEDGPVPPPAKNTQDLLDQSMFDYLVGTWRFEGYIDQGGYRYYVVAEITYRSDGTYAGTEQIQLPSQNGPMPPYIHARIGSFEVTAIDENNFVLTTHERNGSSSKTSLRIIDRTTLEDAVDRRKRSHRVR